MNLFREFIKTVGLRKPKDRKQAHLEKAIERHRNIREKLKTRMTELSKKIKETNLKISGTKTSNHTDALKVLQKKKLYEKRQKEIRGTLTKIDSQLEALEKKNMVAFKRKKHYEKQLQQNDGTLTTIEFKREALKNASTNTEVLKAMGSAATALKSAHNNMDVDKVYDLMDDVAEQQEIAQEISDAILNPVGFGQDVDEDDLLAELEELEQEDLDEKLLNVGEHIAELPPVPKERPSVAKAKAKPVEDDDDLKELEAWAS